MKKFRLLGKAVCIVLALVMSLSIFAGCGAALGEPLLTLGETSISVNMYEFYLSRMKGTYCSALYWGEDAKQAEFWDQWKDVAKKQTFNDYYSNEVLEVTKRNLAILYQFDKLELELPQTIVDEVDKDINKLIEDDANGSKNAFNTILSDYGVNYDMYREICLIKEKLDYVSEYLFGENGSKIGAEIVDEYYNDYYVRFKQIFISYEEYVFEEDENGDLIYFCNGSINKISYDKTNGKAKEKEDGTYVTDKNGDRVYFYTDDEGNERIAYNKKDAYVKEVLDSEGNPVMREFDDATKKMLNSDADAILAETKKGDTAGFDILVKEHVSAEERELYPNGNYISKSVNYGIDVVDKILAMKIGEVKKIPTDSGIHIVMRYELEDRGYALEGNETFFVDSKTGTYAFMPDLVNKEMEKYIADDIKKIEVDNDLLKTVDIKRAGVNFYY